MSATVQPGKDLHVADQAPYDAKPSRGLRGLTSANWALGFNGAVTRHSDLHSDDSLSSRRVLADGGSGGNIPGGSRGANAIQAPKLSSPAISSLGRSNLERRSSAAPSFILRVRQALIDSFALLFCVCLVVALVLSVPLSIFLLLFASF